MIQSLFLLSPVGEVVIERHFRGVVTSRSVCETYWQLASTDLNHHGGVSAVVSSNQNYHSNYSSSVPPVMEVPADESDQGTLYLITIQRDGISYLAVCPAEVSPLLIIEFLNRIASIFVDYFGPPADESTIKENFATIYQLLEEMVDHGWPLTTEPNALKAMIRPPTVMSKLLQSATSSNTVSTALPSGTVSNMPWRASGIYYSNNEIYMDIVEEVDAILDATGNLVSSDVSGSIQCQSHLSGVPDLLLTFKEPQLIDDCSFHPCVRYNRFENEQVISFVPPDGDFELMRYRIHHEQAHNFSPPIYCHTQYSFNKNDPGSGAGMTTGNVTIQAGVTAVSSLIFSASRKGPLQVEDFVIWIPFPKDTRSITSNFVVNMGTVLYDEASKVARWSLGTLDASKKANFSCRFSLPASSEVTAASSSSSPHVSVNWKIPLSSVSGLSVSGLSITGESYRPYKGVRNITKSGRFQVRGN